MFTGEQINKDVTTLYSFSFCPGFVLLGFADKIFNEVVTVVQIH